MGESGTVLLGRVGWEGLPEMMAYELGRNEEERNPWNWQQSAFTAVIQHCTESSSCSKWTRKKIHGIQTGKEKVN